jgi:hypothetical protein
MFAVNIPFLHIVLVARHLEHQCWLSKHVKPNHETDWTTYTDALDTLDVYESLGTLDTLNLHLYLNGM